MANYNYGTNYYPGYTPFVQNQQIQPQQVQQIQNGGFISVPGIDAARNYPVAPGNSVTFKDENAPYVYTKTMGFSPLDRPIFEKFRLVKEEDASVNAQETAEPILNANAGKNTDYALKTDLEAIRGQHKALKEKVDNLLVELGGKDNE